jgi:sugar phosphate isomerase/epimerase
MKLGAYTACLHDVPLPETLKILRDMELTGAEINAGGFISAPHLPIDQLLASLAAREEYLGLFEQAGITLTAAKRDQKPYL